MATMATHNLDKISPPLRYSCQPASDISFTPLNYNKSVSVRQYLRHLEACKVDKRGGGGGGGGGGKKKRGGGGVVAKEQDMAAKEQDVADAALSK